MNSNVMKIIRISFGLILIFFGLNGFFSFLPIPEKKGFAREFLQTLHHTRYILPTVAIIMSTSGFLFTLNRKVEFAILILLPVSFNIFAFHLFHDWEGLFAAIVIFGTNSLLFMQHFKQCRPIFQRQEQ